jgi:hypothetical protein
MVKITMRTRPPILRWLIAILIIIATVGYTLYTARTGRLPDLDCRQNQTERYLPLDSQSPLTQTLFPTANGFTSLTLHPQTDPGSPYSITLHLYDAEDSDSPLAVISRPLRTSHSGKLHFYFKPLPAGRSYQVRITTDAPPESLFLAASSEDRYSHGDLFNEDGHSLPHDLTFNAYYRPPIREWLYLFAQSLPVIIHWLAWTFLIALIGIIIQFIFCSSNITSNSLSIFLLQSIGLGLTFLIVFGYTQSLLRISLNQRSLVSWGLLLLAGAFLHWLINHRKGKQSFSLPAPTWEDAALLLLLFFAFTSRAVQTIGIEPVPLWVDGFNHFNKLLFLANDGILPLHINYPYGWHLLVYIDHFLTGIGLPASAYYTGFWLSALAIPAAWPLARRIFSQQWAAFLAVILYGFFAPFPAYLVTWSRFPFLLGLTLLPLALNAALNWLQSPPTNFLREVIHALPAAALAAGLVLSHYGTIIHYAAFLPVILLAWRIWPDGENPPPLKHQILRLCGLALPAAMILLIKILSLVQRGLWETSLAANQAADQFLDLFYTLKLTTLHGGWLVWGLAIAGLLTALVWKDNRKTTFLTFGWLITLYLLDILQIAILGTAVSSLMNYIIALSLPLSWLAGSAIAGATETLKTFLPKGNNPRWLQVVFLLFLLLSGFTGISGIINPVTILFTEQDHQAMEWITENTPQDAVFYIDSFQWGPGFVPSNGGGWIPALTHRGAVHPRSSEQRESLQDFLVQREANYVYTHSDQPLSDIPLFANASPVFQNETLIIYGLPAASSEETPFPD